MRSDRREFLKSLTRCAAAGTAVAAATGASSIASEHASEHSTGHSSGPADPMAVLVDMTQCIGCRLCEYACRKSNDIEPGLLASYDDQSVFKENRRPANDYFTVINAFDAPDRSAVAALDDPAPKPVYAKVNCMHCNHAACVSACIVGALTKQENGAVVYDAWKCIGCRYCMVACPFQIPTYTYDNVLTPRVRKCEFCSTRLEKGQQPACVEACPRQVLTFAKRNELIPLAHEKILQHPGRYVDHLYGEHEVGGTSWLYLSPIPFKQAGFLTLGDEAPPKLTEQIQHGVFKYWIAPLGWYAFLATAMWYTGRRAKIESHAGIHPHDDDRAQTHNRGPHTPSDPTRSDPNSAPSPRHTTAHAPSNPSTAAFENLTAAFSPSESPRDPFTPSRPSNPSKHSTPTTPPTAETEESPQGVLDTAVALLDHPETASTPKFNPKSASSIHPSSFILHPSPHPHPHPAPVRRKLLTPGVWALIAICLTGAGFMLYRFIFGLAASTNLDQQHPWGLWIAMDVGSGIALAGGGFVTAAVVHIFHREHYHAIARSALLTALLGYTFYVPGLLADIGRWYNIWHPTIPTMWQGNSVLFEVGLCVMIYLNVQYAEMVPIICERLMGESKRFPRLARWARPIRNLFEKMLPALLVLGVALSTFHQSSLGNLMVIAPYKLHALWWTPWSPLLFLLSAMMVGFPMVIFTMLFASWCLKRRPEMHVLAPLARYIPVFIFFYLAVKVADMIARHTQVYLLDGSIEGISYIAEMVIGVILPILLLMIPAVRRSPRWLGASCLMVILGVVLNRLNVFVIGYHPPFATKSYFPSITEFAVSIGLVAALLLVYRIAVTYLPILEPRQMTEAA